MIVNKRELNQIQLLKDSEVIGYVDYAIIDDLIEVLYIYLEPIERGKGLTRGLVDETARFIMENNFDVMLICPVIGRFLKESYPNLKYQN
jgi:predicted GNAT family acetyltransferase